jgi:hypothetical protein
MALTFAQKMYTRDGSKKHVVYQVTHDESTTSITAANLGMHYIDYALAFPVTLTTTIDGTKVSMLSIAGPSHTVALANALSAGELFTIEAWGW